jgi:AcrR family transcriptional regulator
MGRPRVHDDSTRERLFRAAEALVALGGIDALSVRGLAEAAATTTRAVYSVFEGKDGIVRALYREAWVVLRQRLVAVPETADPAGDLVRAGLEAFRRFALERPNLFRLAFEGRLPLVAAPEDLSASLAALAELERRVQRCADAGLLGGKPARLVALQFHALCQGFASNELSGWYVAVQDPERLWRTGLGALLQGMAVPEASRRQPPGRKPRAPRAQRKRGARRARPRQRA